MLKCPYCSSQSLKQRGVRTTVSGEPRYQYQCLDCSKYTTFASDIGIEPPEEIFTESFVRDEAWLAQHTKKQTYVITSAQSNSVVDDEFLESLLTYCDVKDAELLIVPIKYGTGSREHNFEDHIKQYLIENNVRLHPRLRLLGSLRISATADNPLTGLSAVSQGDSIILGHNQLQLSTLPVASTDHPVIMCSTGSISVGSYSETKSGYKAEFNHSNSAAVVELDGSTFHIRHLNWDGECFYDLDTKYTATNYIDEQTVEALVTGDEHAAFADPFVKMATYLAPDSIAKTLKPAFIVRHDLLDCYSVSHHHKKNVFIQYAKHKRGMNDIEAEIGATIQHVIDTTPRTSTNIIVASNHNDHLMQWLKECEPKEEPWNALFYHRMMYEILSRTSMGVAGAEYPNAFRLYSEPLLASAGVSFEFLGRNQEYKIKNIDVTHHGDRGSNGSKGSRKQFSQLPSKTIIGHSHSPGIEKGCYQVGTSSFLNLEYSSGPSSWLHTHCIIHKNGKRQLINIINGKWKR